MNKYVTTIILVLVCCITKAQNVLQAEYFFDNNDSGFGICTPITLIPSVDSTWQFSPSLSAAGLSLGNHKLYIRIKDSNNHWSHTIRRNIQVLENSDDKQVIDVEYFFTNDLGFSSCYNLPLTPSSDSTWVFNIPYNQIPLFNVDTTIFLRVRDSLNNDWSHTVKKRQLFYPSSVGISETLFGNGFRIFPNPASDYLTITFNNITSPVQFSLINTLGEIVLSKEISEQTSLINLAHSPGIYFVKLNSANSSAVRIIIIKDN